MRTLSPGFLCLLGVAAACAGTPGLGPAPSQVTASAGDNQIGPAGQLLVTR